MIVPVLLGLMLCLSEAALPNYCTAVYDQPGECISVYNCDPILEILERYSEGAPLTDEEQHLLSNSRCSKTDEDYVCCKDEVNIKGLDLLKQQIEDCGKNDQEKVLGGRKLPLGARPWMALLQYKCKEQCLTKCQKEECLQFECGGTLITDRFVLTAAHCVTSSLVGVRLGEYNTSSPVDCEDKDTCAPPFQDVGIEKAIVHEKWDQDHTQHDIALLKLNRSVDIRRTYIRSICLPLTEELQKEAENQQSLFISGWGKTQIEKSSDVPMEASLKVLDRNDCSKAYNSTTIGRHHICAGGGPTDSCNGDSGGPLQYPLAFFGAQRFVQMGIVSFGSQNCGSKAAVYTNVGQFIPWITQKLAKHISN